ncbi:MAG: ABC transporter permease [Tabrizicola sp.]|uniref:ABC transporter permease n=1 Tax=Tabrizicola sp. TaxID=2005166 RepID=UPI0027376D55|nr:ABC transporter permease [Tabrizicola sp.]MDP3263192.1 ABC transporter permease [Tabrizicola sp.]MDP3646549.1 ABC transporter permease [Paracoccaceae bacterium]MDZ4069480.1 ABC transporter permease [Tabrizicola sp.]
MKKAPFLGGYAILYLLFLYGPIIILPLFAFNDGRIVAFPLNGFTTRWFTEMFADAQLKKALLNSLTIALSSATLATVLGVFAARATVRYRWPGKPAALGLIMVPLVLPEMIVAMALLVVLLSIGIPLSIFTIILGHVLICMPFAVAILTSAFQSLDRSLEEASLDLGETQWSTFRLIVLPLVMPGILSSFLITFTISIDEFIISNFLGSGQPILSVYIFGQFRFPAKVPSMLALGTLLVLFSICMLAIAEYFRRRGIAKTGGKDTGGFL